MSPAPAHGPRRESRLHATTAASQCWFGPHCSPLFPLELAHSLSVSPERCSSRSCRGVVDILSAEKMCPCRFSVFGGLGFIYTSFECQCRESHGKMSSTGFFL